MDGPIAATKALSLPVRCTERARSREEREGRKEKCEAEDNNGLMLEVAEAAEQGQ